MFAAEMRMHPASKPADKKRRVNKLLKLMDLTACKDVIVGSPMVKGISGGQRKRLCVAGKKRKGKRRKERCLPFFFNQLS